MGVLRKDPTTARWVVFPGEATAPPPVDGRCPFCAGNEALTPPEIVAWGRDAGLPANSPGWTLRVVPNAAPHLRIEEPLERRPDGMYDSVSATGAHEIVIETPRHCSSLVELSPIEVQRVLAACAQRIEDLKRDHRIRSIFVFKNRGLLSGAALPGHTHTQVIGLPVTPKALKEILAGARQHFLLHERCVFCDVIEEELERDVRVIATTPRFVALAPYAARHPFELWILPRRHGPDYEATNGEDRADLAQLLLGVLSRLERALPDPAYNLFFYSGPNRAAYPTRWKTLDADFHWHIQILPRLARLAGFEVGSGFYANHVTPEQTAATLKSLE
jgi:UDPglucose--hexose-1-phosphate uridylyltransferase